MRLMAVGQLSLSAAAPPLCGDPRPVRVESNESGRGAGEPADCRYRLGLSHSINPGK